MRNVVRVFGLVVLLFLLTAAAHAQDDDTSQTLLDQLRAGEDYGLLLDALEAEGELIERLDEPDASLTLFAPDDRAFAGTLEAAELTTEDLMSDAETLREVLAHHIIPARYSAETLRANPLTYVMTALDERGLLIQTAEGQLFVNAVRVTPAAAPAANGYLHEVAQLLIPPVPLYEPEAAPEIPDATLADMLREAGGESDYAAFAELLADGAPDLLERLDAPGPYTVLAPSDAALTDYLAANDLTRDDLLADEAALAELLAHHVLPGRVSSGTVTALIPRLREEDDFLLLALDGTSVLLDVDDETITADEGVMLTEADRFAANGVLHGINGVLVPPPPPEADASGA